MTSVWVDCDVEFVRRRYDRIASLIPLFEWLLAMPRSLRKNAAERLNLHQGDSVLEIGCGTGRNFPFLQRAVGSSGRIYGVDLSKAMLTRARTLCTRQRWTNVELFQTDAVEFELPHKVDAILFGLSYNTMPHHRAVLSRACQQLRPGGRIVIMDAKPPRGRLGDWSLPIGAWLMKRTLLGNPYVKPWEHLALLVSDLSIEEYLFGSYYLCYGSKHG